MYYIKPTPNESGAYGSPQTGQAPGLYALPDELLPQYIEYSGFVIPKAGADGMITELEPNLDAWEAWKASQPPEEPETAEPTEAEQLRADVDYIAAMTGVTL